VLLQLIHELAVYEREPDAVETTEPQLHDALFGSTPVAWCHVAVDDDGAVVGFALWHLTFSTWRGRAGIWLEDLFVRPVARGSGLGKALLQELAQICTARGYGRLEWWVLDWNEPAIGFYRSLGAEPQEDWTTFRLHDEALERLAATRVLSPVRHRIDAPGARHWSDRRLARQPGGGMAELDVTATGAPALQQANGVPGRCDA
jgi:GNAT superfamily N-acetyltransferase